MLNPKKLYDTLENHCAFWRSNNSSENDISQYEAIKPGKIAVEQALILNMCEGGAILAKWIRQINEICDESSAQKNQRTHSESNLENSFHKGANEAFSDGYNIQSRLNNQKSKLLDKEDSEIWYLQPINLAAMGFSAYQAYYPIQLSLNNFNDDRDNSTDGAYDGSALVTPNLSETPASGTSKSVDGPINRIWFTFSSKICSNFSSERNVGAKRQGNEKSSSGDFSDVNSPSSENEDDLIFILERVPVEKSALNPNFLSQNNLGSSNDDINESGAGKKSFSSSANIGTFGKAPDASPSTPSSSTVFPGSSGGIFSRFSEEERKIPLIYSVYVAMICRKNVCKEPNQIPPYVKANTGQNSRPRSSTLQDTTSGSSAYRSSLNGKEVNVDLNEQPLTSALLVSKRLSRDLADHFCAALLKDSRNM